MSRKSQLLLKVSDLVLNERMFTPFSFRSLYYSILAIFWCRRNLWWNIKLHENGGKLCSSQISFVPHMLPISHKIIFCQRQAIMSILATCLTEYNTYDILVQEYVTSFRTFPSKRTL